MTGLLKPLEIGARQLNRKWHYLDLDNANRAPEPDPLRIALAEAHTDMMRTRVFFDQLILLNQVKQWGDRQALTDLSGPWDNFDWIMEVPRVHELVEFSGAITDKGRAYLLAVEQDMALLERQCGLRHLHCTPFHPFTPMAWTFRYKSWSLFYRPLSRGLHFVREGSDTAQFMEGPEFSLTYTPSVEEGALSCAVVTTVTDEGLWVIAERGPALLRAASPVILPFPILWAIEEARRIQEYDGKEKTETTQDTPE